jgi:uncharacterized membrane protein YbhN (UPF0104 family)
MNLLARSSSSKRPSPQAPARVAAGSRAGSSKNATPDELNPRRLRRRLLQFALIGLLIAIVVLVGPGLGDLRHHLSHAKPGWLVAALALEVLSALSYVLIFRAVFCPRMAWRLSYQIGMSEQAANSVLSLSGTGGLALGAWALRRGGMSAEQIGRKTVAFFFLTSLANVAAVIVFAALYAVGVLHNDRDAPLTYGAGAAALAATLIVPALAALLRREPPAARTEAGRLAAAARFARRSLAYGVRDGLLLLRRGSVGVVLGGLGTTAFDIAVLGACFRAFGYTPPIGVLALGYLIGQLGGNLPLPGGIGGLDAGLIGTFALYHQPLVVSTAAVLVYHAIALWIPGLLGSIAFVQLRRTLQREAQPAAICMPLAAPIEAVPLPSRVGAASRRG